ncbi:TonB-dependent receptor [Alteromonas aestuariivivens]|uniref:TonB-dependent receptor n=1 Tax=Alteromonas aestuariivivens TaxID=1938339 RepID=A0A3D8MC63_9ALTE|nr:TonB-dependent receptor [Alteromonas aestuariivivens]RDV27991.1 TonB-dependent receptor [Alteromonas aestuariivivens]
MGAHQIHSRATATSNLRYSALALFVSAALVPQGFAQQVANTAPEQDSIEVISVSGIRASIRDSVQAKRAADNIIDGVSAEDIGQLPDISIADSIRRIVGVNFSTQNGEPAFASIRGLGPDLTLTTLNGRVLSTTDQATRRVSLGRLPSELIQSVYVSKTPKASMLEGGVAGTIQMQTIKPLSKDKRVFNGLFRALTNDNAREIDTATDYGWRGTLNYIDQFQDDRLGIALGWAGLKNDTPNYEARTGNPLERNGPAERSDFNANGIRDITVGAVSNDVVEREIDRNSLLGVVQYRVSDNLEINFDASWVKQDQLTENNRLIYEVLPGPANNATSAEEVLIDNDTDVILGFTSGQANPLININPNNNEDETLNLGLSFDYVAEDMEAKLDLSHSNSSRDRTNRTFQIGANFVDGMGVIRPLAFDMSDPDYLYLQIDPSLAAADAWAIRNMLDMRQFSEDTVDSIALDMKSFHYSGDFIDSIEFGLRYEDRDVFRSNDRDNYRFNSGNPPANWLDLSSSELERDSFAYSDIWQALGGVSQDQTFPHYSAQTMYELVQQVVVNEPERVFVDGEELNFDYTSSHDINEKTLAAYIMLNFASEIGSMPLSGNMGVRVVRTDVSASGFSNDLSKLQLEPGIEEGSYNVIFDNTNPDNIETITSNHDYLKVLPSLNATLTVKDDVLLRLAAARTMSKAPFERMTPGSFVRAGNEVDSVILNAGNPAIDPFTSDQMDVALEWYPNADTSLAATIYYKHVEAYLVESIVEVDPITSNGLTAPAFISQLVNDDSSNYFRGIELSYSQNFSFLPAPFDGFGLQANASFNETNAKEIGQGTDPSGPGGRTPIEVPAREVSDEVYNLIGFYEKGGLSVRLAWQYQSPFMRLPLTAYETRDGGQLDMTFGYQINKNLRLIGSVTNLTDENIRVYRIDERDYDNEQILERITNTGRAYTLGMRFTF